MMKTAEQLRDKFKLDLEKLQAKCKHSKVTKWITQYWAPAHSTGKQVRVCEICEKIVDIKDGYPEDWYAHMQSVVDPDKVIIKKPIMIREGKSSEDKPKSGK